MVRLVAFSIIVHAVFLGHSRTNVTGSVTNNNTEDAEQGWGCYPRLPMKVVAHGQFTQLPDVRPLVSTRTENKLKEGKPLCDGFRGFNPYDRQCYAHLAIFKTFDMGKLKETKGITVDFLGMKLPYPNNCVANTYPRPYSGYIPSREVDCARNRLYKTSGASHLIEYPLPDEEYFEYEATLRSALVAKPGGEYIICDIGARDGIWAIRGVLASRLRGKSARQRIIAVEPAAESIQMLKQALELNNIAMGSVKIYPAFFGKGPPGSTPTVKLSQILQTADHVDVLNLDCQGAEQNIVTDGEDAKALRTKVHMIIMSVHVVGEPAQKIQDTLRQNGFIFVTNIPMHSDVITPLGKIPFGDGRIVAINTRFKKAC